MRSERVCVWTELQQKKNPYYYCLSIIIIPHLRLHNRLVKHPITRSCFFLTESHLLTSFALLVAVLFLNALLPFVVLLIHSFACLQQKKKRRWWHHHRHSNHNNAQKRNYERFFFSSAVILYSSLVLEYETSIMSMRRAFYLHGTLQEQIFFFNLQLEMSLKGRRLIITLYRIFFMFYCNANQFRM